MNIKDGDVSDFAGVNLQRHGSGGYKAAGRNGSGCGGASQWGWATDAGGLRLASWATVEVRTGIGRD
jgi:hypothetical protein